jgi:8-oxo-dGTP pyrophosphatase MutT (NUDIX family)
MTHPRAESIPRSSAETDRRHRFATALIEQGGRFLITQRCAPDALVGLWEFPSAKVEPGDSDQATVARALRERLGIDVGTCRWKASRTQRYAGYSVETALYETGILASQEPRALAVADFRWAAAADLEHYRFVFADQATTDLLLGIERESRRLFRDRAADSRPDQDRAK